MVRKLSISPEESDLSLPTGEEDRDVKDGDRLSSNFPTWSSRFKCLEAYVCLVLNLNIILEQHHTIARYGSVVFLAYAIYAVVLGVPIVFVEVLLGRYVMGNVTKAWSMCPMGKGILACLFGTTVYAIVTNNIKCAYLIKYLFSLHFGNIQWNKCRKPWAKENCYVIVNNGSSLRDCIQKHSRSYCMNITWESSGAQYWKYVVGSTTDVYEICFTATYSLLSICLVVLINLKGHKSCEKVFIILVYLPVLISIVLTFTAYSSLGALRGLMYYLEFNWSFFFKVEMWLTVFEDFLYSLDLGTLALSFVSSHGHFTDNIFIDVLVVVFTVIFSPSFLVIPVSSVFSATQLLYTDAPIAESVFASRETDGIITLVEMSEALLLYAHPNVFWSFLFYLQLVLLSIGTQAIMTLAVSEAIGELFFRKSILCNSITVAIITFALGTPYLFFMFAFEPCLHTFVITIIFLYAITWQFQYGYKRFKNDFHFMLGYPPSLFFHRIFWLSIIPVFTLVLGVKIIHNTPSRLPHDKVYIYMAIPVVVYLLVGVVQIIRAARKGNIKIAFTADPNWGPDDPVLKMSRVIFDTRTITKEFMYRQELFRKPLMKPPDFSDQNIVQLL